MKRLFPIGTALLAFVLTAPAQESFFTESATQPAVGIGYLRTKLELRRLDEGRQTPKADEWRSVVRYTHGIRHNVSLGIEASVISLRPDRGGNRTGWTDPQLLAKWRVVQMDTGPVNTVRGSLIGGAGFPAGHRDWTSKSVDPLAGAALTSILGRHGLNADLLYQNRSGSGPEAGGRLNAGGAWLYRISPVRWQADTTASFYSVMEVRGKRREGNDRSVTFAPGLLYEARSWAAEVAFLLPAYDRMKRSSPLDRGVAFGFRRLF